MVKEFRKTRLFYLTTLLEKPRLVRDIPHPVSYNALVSDLILLQKGEVVRIRTGRTEKLDQAVRLRPVTMRELESLFPRLGSREEYYYGEEPTRYIESF